MEMSRQERIELHDRYVAKLESVRQSLMARFPEVLSVDLGLKRSHDRLTEQLSWRIFVKEKKREGDLAPEQRLPREIEGLPTDVHVQKAVTLEEGDSSSYSSLAGGIQIDSGLGGGTLGCFVNVIGDTKVYLLSNHHALIGYQGSLGKLVGQPGAACDLCCCKCCEVATVTAGSGMVPSPPGGTPNTVDAAIALLKGQNPGDTTITPYVNSITEIGPVFGSGTAVFGDPVRKRGAGTRLTHGTIASTTFSSTVNLNHDPSPPTATCTDCIEIAVASPSLDWSVGGDSGSAVVNATGQVVALHFGGVATSGYACKIANIASRLNITVMVSGTTGTVPHGGFVLEAPMPVAHPATFLQQIEQKIKGATGGDQFLHAVHENRREVLDLINDHREVKVAWNRFQGPAFVGHLAKNVTEPAHRVPKEVNGYTLQHLLIKMSDVLERHGSRALARAVEDYSAVAFDFADQYEGFDSIDTLIQRANLCPNCGQPQTLNRHAE